MMGKTMVYARRMSARGQRKVNAGTARRARREATTLLGKLGDPALFAERFWARADTSDPDGCWPWRGIPETQRYGQYRLVGAHRVAFWIATGIDPGNFMVLHSCDNETCVQPKHLRTGTNSDNMLDRSVRGRFVKKGAGKPRHTPGTGARKKVTAEQVAELRARYARGDISQRALAADYGLTQGYVSQIIAGTER